VTSNKSVTVLAHMATPDALSFPSYANVDGRRSSPGVIPIS
jgi:hypothetical protein